MFRILSFLAFAFQMIPLVEARVYDLYRADYPKGAFCSAIAGACASDTDLENAFFQNPAALTASGKQDWNFDGDYNNSSSAEPGMKANNSVNEDQFMGGAGWSNGTWGVGLGMIGIHDSVTASVGITDDTGFVHNFPIDSSGTSLEFHLPFSYRVGRFSLGLSINANAYTFSTNPGNSDTSFGIGFTMGVIEQINSKFRWGAWWKAPVTNYVTAGFNIPAFQENNLVYSEDMAIHYPWILAGGLSYMPWEDKRTFYFDIDTIGPTAHAFQLTYDTYAATSLGRRSLRRKGRNLAFEPRLAYRTPWPWETDSKGTLHMGTYLETSRWDGLPSRIHYTGGVSYQVFEWFELMGGLDFAKDFMQIFLTFR